MSKEPVYTQTWIDGNKKFFVTVTRKHELTRVVCQNMHIEKHEYIETPFIVNSSTFKISVNINIVEFIRINKTLCFRF